MQGYLRYTCAMKKPLLCLLCLVWFSANAQTDSIKPKAPFAEGVDIYHGIYASYSTYDIPALGYNLDLHMRKRLYLFTKYLLVASPESYYTLANNGYNLMLNTYFNFAFRFNKPGARFNYFPYVGFMLPVLYYSSGYNTTNNFGVFGHSPGLSLGGEVKCRLNNKRTLGFGIDASSYHGFSLFFKYNWNKQYKRRN